MEAVHGRHDDEGAALQRYAGFLRRQAEQSGLGSRALEKLFVESATREEEEASKQGRRPQNPIRDMTFSKSHIDRLLAARARPHPPRPFTRQFLLITSRAAGLSKQEYEKRLSEAVSLADALSVSPSTEVAPRPRPAPVLHAETVPELKLKLELERARHLETRLRYALSDTRSFVMTLWDIISALRDIISGRDELQGRERRVDADRASPSHVQRLTEQALAHKRAAQGEADHALARIRVLEERWEQAQADVHRLSLHADIAELPGGDASSTTPTSPPFLPQDLFMQPALTDIAAALEKAHLFNAQQDASARTLEEEMTGSGPLAGDDERAVLLQATRLSDPASRRTALRSLVSLWGTESSDTREVLLRMASDVDPGIRVDVAEWVASWDAPPPHSTLSLLAADIDSEVRGAAARSLAAVNWPEHHALDTLLQLTRDQDVQVRSVAADVMTEQWTNSPVARDALLQLLLDGREDASTRSRALEGLLENWVDAPETRDALLKYWADEAGRDRPAQAAAQAVAALLGHWLHVPHVHAAILQLDPTSSLYNLAMPAVYTRWGGSQAVRSSLIQLAQTDEVTVQQALREATAPTAELDIDERAGRFRSTAMLMLRTGWKEDPLALDTALRLARDPLPRVRGEAATALAIGWPQNAAARDALRRLAHDDDRSVQQLVKSDLQGRLDG